MERGKRWWGGGKRMGIVKGEENGGVEKVKCSRGKKSGNWCGG